MSAEKSTYSNPVVANCPEYRSQSGYSLPEYPFILPPELDATRTLHDIYPIVIVGGGISGLTTACSLASIGMPCMLLDEDNTVGVRGASSRGICYAQKSLETFKRLGIYERIAAKGVQWSVGRTFAGHDEVYSFNLREQSAYSFSEQPPFINIQQFYIEGFLVERLMELGVTDLRWQSRVTAFEQHDQFAQLSVETPAGSYAIKARYVIDATGLHSQFRDWCGVTVQRKAGDDRWCIADVRFKEHPPVERHTWIEAPFNENRAVWQHLMADDVWRLDYQMAPDCDMKDVAREEVVRERLKRQFGSDVECEIVWVGPYAYRSECLDEMRSGRVFFVGDSAHVVSPFGARGGNTGLQDGDNLAWKLAAVLRGLAGESLLDTYHSERHEAAQENVKVTNRTARFLRPADGIERVFRDAVIALAKRYAFARPLVNTGRMSVANTYTRHSNDNLPSIINIQNVQLDGVSLSEHILRAQGRLLIVLLGGLQAAVDERIVQVHHAKDAAQFAAACCLSDTASPQFVVIRPDSYLAAHGTTARELDEALRHCLHLNIIPSAQEVTA
jgi:3-(3-hydroxy-phenyl)propionate hydroxylase